MFTNANVLRKKIQEAKKIDILETKRSIIKKAISSALSVNETIAKVPLTKEDLEDSWLDIVVQELKEANYTVAVVDRKKLVDSDIIFADLVIDWE